MASTYLSKTLPSAGGGVYKWTYSFWVKRSSLGEKVITGARFSGSFNGIIRFTSGDALEVYDYRNSFILQKITSRLFRDTNAWYHIVVSNDNSVSSPETEIYVNGIKETSFSTTNEYSQNETTSFNNDYPNYIGQTGASSQYFDGSMAHFHYIDGTAYAASTFGETDSTTGIWKPKTAPSVTYGTNGFFLKFENSAAFGTDSSGNSNTFTVNGTMTQTIDTPSNVFATMSPLYPNTQYGTFSNGNNTVVGNSATNASTNNSTIGASQGKWYMEYKIIQVRNTSYPGVGMIGSTDASNNIQVGTASNSVSYRAGGTILTGGSTTATINSFVANDIIGIAMDLDNGAVYFSKNGTWENSGDPTSGASKTGSLYSFTPSDLYHFSSTVYQSDSSVSSNFGNGYFGTTAVSSAQNPDDGIGIFEYDVPTGYRALCTKSINAEEYS